MIIPLPPFSSFALAELDLNQRFLHFTDVIPPQAIDEFTVLVLVNTIYFKVLKNGAGGRLKREGIYIYLWLMRVDVWQKLTQYCKAIILQLKINIFKKE